MKLKPISDHIIVKRFEPQEKSSGGIILSPAHTEKENRGEVLAVGEGWITSEGRLIPLEIKVGQKIIFHKGAGVEIKDEDQEKYTILRQSDVLAIAL
jgi:chaperonin GroES